MTRAAWLAAALSLAAFAAPVRAQVLSADVIRRIVHRNIPPLRFCYERELARTHGQAAPGPVRLVFVIAPSGAVRQAHVTGSRASPRLAGCLEKQLRRMRFPPPAGGGTVTIRYPLNVDAQ